MTTAAAALSLLPISLSRRPFSRSPSFIRKNGGIAIRGGFKVLAVFGEEGVDGGLVRKSNAWEAIFDVEDPRPRAPQTNGKFLDANQAFEVVRFDIQYCDWRARQDLLSIMLLHDKRVGSNPEYNSKISNNLKRVLINGII